MYFLEPLLCTFYLTNTSQRALYTIGNQPKYGQKLITLSTCTNDGQDNRLIVIAVQK